MKKTIAALVIIGSAIVISGCAEHYGQIEALDA